MSKVIVIGSQKGGVGKTTTTLNLAYSLCSMGKKVLAIDLDSQANLSTCYGIENTKDLEYTIGHLLMAQIEEEEPEELDKIISNYIIKCCIYTIRIKSDKSVRNKIILINTNHNSIRCLNNVWSFDSTSDLFSYIFKSIINVSSGCCRHTHRRRHLRGFRDRACNR